MRIVLCLILLAAISPSQGFSATLTDQIQSAATEGKFTYVMFYRANNSATARMAKTIDSQVSESADRTTSVKVHVNSPAGASLVKRFDASRIPLPAVFTLAPNDAVTGVHRVNVTRGQLKWGIITPKHAEIVKAVQQQKVVVLCLQPAEGAYVPSGVKQFEDDPQFQGKTFRVVANSNEPTEANLFKRMKVSTDITSPRVIVFAPPGVYLGTFDADVSGATLANKVHDSGQCNCRECQERRNR